jgi:predicted RNA-binding protein associated with RNAse of E/G family
LTFAPGDILRELFSWAHPYNAFSVFDPDHRHKGWYANVTYPSWVELESGEPILIWHDLLLDVVADSSGDAINLDDDELEDSDLAATDPGLHAAIVAARDDILVNLRQRTGPFSPAVW